MKNRQNIFGLGALLIIIYFLFQGGIWIISNKTGIGVHCGEIKTLIAANQQNWSQIYTSSFDEAVECRTDLCKKEKIKAVLLSLQDTDKPKFFQTSYFIRLNGDGNIEKWFWSGEVATTIPTSRGERRVASLLQGKSSPICTQNWKIDGTITQMTYLRDGYSEAETILPIKDEDGQILGAIVSRFGD